LIVVCHSQPLNLDSRFLNLCENSGISSKYYTGIFLVNPKNRRLEHPIPYKGLGIYQQKSHLQALVPDDYFEFDE
jgi:hypothetical protein